jgi:hypothetical protein
MAPRKQRYRAGHDRLRRQWALQVAAGNAYCARCGFLIVPSESFDVDHEDGSLSEYLGVSHSSCNRRAGARRGAELRRAAQNGNANGNAYSAREIAAIRKRHREDVERWYSRDW